MLAEGKNQWNKNYPTLTNVVDDIEKGIAYVIELAGNVVAYGAIVSEGEPAYDYIDGAWLSSERYIVVHRLAVHQRIERKGLAIKFLQEVEKIAQSRDITSFRIDTNYDNQRMFNLACKCGFTYCGEVIYKNGTRKAFEKLLSKLLSRI